MRVWLQEVQWSGNDWGWEAWSLDHIGFATWAPTRGEVILRIPGKFEEYQQWLTRHGSVTIETAPNSVIIVEEISGDEVAFEHDLVPAEREEIFGCLKLLSFSRRDLLAAVTGLSESLLDWDPPYRHFAEWAGWRTIRQIVKHVAMCEVDYYLPAVGYSGSGKASLFNVDWREQLLSSRRETERFLVQLADSYDRARITSSKEVWSVRKVLRRLVRHELLHWKSIKRIVQDYDQRTNQIC